ncbi:hypothetical protein M5K25_013694 [Dendrobium thyrsiflorum]|uniref:Uncharacterized protein n=1 Tax=Dendrobium thyrsiflorum TaxID=117978 RepID=A0ABD0UTQ8_DENTH
MGFKGVWWGFHLVALVILHLSTIIVKVYLDGGFGKKKISLVSKDPTPLPHRGRNSHKIKTIHLAAPGSRTGDSTIPRLQIKCCNVMLLSTTNTNELEKQWDCLLQLCSSPLVQMVPFISKQLSTKLYDVSH